MEKKIYEKPFEEFVAEGWEKAIATMLKYYPKCETERDMEFYGRTYFRRNYVVLIGQKNAWLKDMLEKLWYQSWDGGRLCRVHIKAHLGVESRRTCNVLHFTNEKTQMTYKLFSKKMYNDVIQVDIQVEEGVNPVVEGVDRGAILEEIARLERDMVRCGEWIEKYKDIDGKEEEMKLACQEAMDDIMENAKKIVELKAKLYN